MAGRFNTALLVLSNLLIPVAILTFAAGFFPYKPFLPGLATRNAAEQGEPAPAQFDRVIFMVVDALRSDFVFGYSSGFEFTQSLIRDGAALPFTAHATSPTVTMPRVKALTTGGIPSFLDVIMNFAESDTSSLASQDTWLGQIKAKGGRIVMHGDDTWHKLFPDTFARTDGTTSFFVSDFTEVDNNVTRHVPDELRANDWDALILHYLGLDHIGHKAGPLSPNMLPKQREMDGIVKLAYEAIGSQPHLKNTLLVLCGDHGMTDGGNHGGSAPGETSPALVFISPKFKDVSPGIECPAEPEQDFEYYVKVEQSDIVPTLAGLLGLPVSLNNLGVFIPKLLPLWKDQEDHIQLLLENAWQMLTLVKATFPHEAYDNPYLEMNCTNPSTSTLELACKWRRVTDVVRGSGGQPPAAPVLVPALFDFCKATQRTMSSTASNYNMSYLIAGIGASAAALLFGIVSARSIFSQGGFDILCFAGLCTTYGALVFASSYVEEEHNFWYWKASIYITLLSTRNLHIWPVSKFTETLIGWPYAALILPAHRIIRAWNQTGQKFAGGPDLVTSFLQPHPVLLWTLIAFTYLLVSLRLGQRLSRGISQDFRILAMSAAAGIAVPAFIFKLSFTARDAPEIVASVVSANGMRILEELPLVLMARVVFYGVGLATAWVIGMEIYIRKYSTMNPRQLTALGGAPEVLLGLRDVLTIFLLTQTRAHNIPLFLLFMFEAFCLSESTTGAVSIAVSIILASHTSFFALGNTNAISSVDLSLAYNGVSNYNVGIVGLLIFAGNWAGPIWWSFAGLHLLADRQQRNTRRSKTFAFLQENQRSWINAERAHLANSARDEKVEKVDPKQQTPEQQAPFFTYVALQTIFITSSLLAIMVACTSLRTHLFIWTVFSPKYLYSMAWGLGWHLLVSCGILGGLWWFVDVS